MARIVGGQLKGLALIVPGHIRATEEKVRQALFNILGSRVVGARLIDGFAGSGLLGIEALSRGAQRVVFLESDSVCLRAIRQNLARLKLGMPRGSWAILRGDALRSLRVLARQAEVFDFIILDPPYEKALGEKALKIAAVCDILPPAGLICLEHSCRVKAPSGTGYLTLTSQHRYGDTVLSFYQRQARGLC